MKKLTPTLIISLLFLSLGLSQQIIHTETYENENIKSITYHKKTRDKIEKVKFVKYYENGEKSEKGNYKDGKELDSFNTWDKNGKIMVKDGNGLNTWWYENGQKRSETTFKDGKEDGFATKWYENGIIENIQFYKDGKMISETYWNEDGSVME